MNQYAQMIRLLKTPAIMKRLTHLYGQRDGVLLQQTARYTHMLKKHEEIFDASGSVLLISAPGRTEIGGNHTDHNHGKVLAAAINLDTLAAVSKRKDRTVRIFSDGYEPLEMNLDDLALSEAERGTTAALVRGVAKKLQEEGFVIGGFDAAITSTVRSGSGLSSSAAFEVLVCAIFDALFNNWRMDPMKRAQYSQFAENVYFNKPSGLMDQMASSVGGLTYIDFKNDQPKIEAISYDFAARGFAMVVVNTGGSHDDLTDHYAAIPKEMREVAACFGETSLRKVRPEQFMQSIPMVREKLGAGHADRPILRAAHFYEENRRVDEMADALRADDLKTFLANVIESGQSSAMYLQNIYATSDAEEVALALMLADQKLKGKGAWRIHGGGFAGTTLNFVPQKELDPFLKEMNAVFGEHSSQVLDIRPEGAASIDLFAN
ncbi:MAG TPA: galactokinase family protein [Candidatus Limiplasma sp.]|nr:galactokinase family protein [Candidatus Limiplasma sp.]HPS80514.1 galactokinase family protein [Candidatus Limiplasma sp.]